MAAAIAGRFGLPPAAIEKRMAVGRFRVKANVDLAVARRLVTELEGLGAVCSVIDADAAAKPAPAPAPAPAPTPAPAPAPTPAPTPAPAPAPAPAAKPEFASGLAHAAPVSSKAAAPAPASSDRSGDQYQSGLSAAFGAPSESGADIGALAVDTGSFSLATLDGDEEAAPPEPKADSAEPAAPMDDDLFAPPEASAEKQLELQVDESALPRKTPPPMAAQPDPGSAPPSMLEQLAEMQSDTPPPMPAVAPSAAATPAAAATPTAARRAAAAPAEPLPVRARKLLGEKPHLRLAAGLLLCILLGFLPAHVFASIRERSAYDAARHDVREATHEYVSAITEDDVERLGNNLRQVRRDAISRMESTQSNIALMGLVIWAACGLGVGFVWFRKIDWDQ